VQFSGHCILDGKLPTAFSFSKKRQSKGEDFAFIRAKKWGFLLQCASSKGSKNTKLASYDLNFKKDWFDCATVFCD
jgi:hypothetical protein